MAEDTPGVVEGSGGESAGVSGPITIVLADDHAVVREGIREIIERSPDMEVVGEAGDGETAVELAASKQPQVALLDIRLPGITGIEAASRIATVSPGTRVLILSAYAEQQYMESAMDAGVHGYLLKSVPGRELLDSIRAVRSGAMILDRSLPRVVLGHGGSGGGSAIAGGIGGGGQAGGSTPLTAREVEIAQLVARGYRNKQVARELGITLRTVESHLEHMFDKIGIQSRTELSMYAVAHGLVDPGKERD